MKTVIVKDAPLELGVGTVINLSREQAEARAYALEPVEGRKETWRTTAPVSFKVGERFKADEATLPRAYRDDKPPTKARSANAPAPKPAKAAKKARAAQAPAPKHADAATKKDPVAPPPLPQTPADEGAVAEDDAPKPMSQADILGKRD